MWSQGITPALLSPIFTLGFLRPSGSALQQLANDFWEFAKAKRGRVDVLVYVMVSVVEVLL